MAELSIELPKIPAVPGIDPRPVLAAAAYELKKCWQERFRDLDQEGNKSGFPEKHFWIKEGANRVGVSLGDSEAVVRVDSRPVAFRYAGGTVRPRTGKGIAIPQTPDASRFWPSNYPRDLFFVPVARGNLLGLLCGEDGPKGKGGKSAAPLHVQYLLVRKASVKPMGDRLMPAPESAARVSAKAESEISRQLRKSTE